MSCLWSRDGDYESDTWQTQCGHYFTIIEGTPMENDMLFCCYCGNSLEELEENNDADH